MLKELHAFNQGEYKHQDYPFLSVGPKGDELVVESEGDVPAGYTLPNGSTKGGKAKATETPTTNAVAGNSDGQAVNSSEGAQSSDLSETDAAGVVWDPTLHAATKTKTQAGLWRMKVGVKRPEGQDVPKAGENLEKLDL